MLPCTHGRLTGPRVRSVGLLTVAVLGSGCGFATSMPPYQRGNVDVMIAGGDVSPLLQCLRDARVGSLDRLQNPCRRITTTRIGLVLKDTVVFVTTTTVPRRLLHSGNRVRVELNGGTATTVTECVNDVRDGSLSSQVRSCRHLAMAGNAATFARVNVRVSR